MKEGERRRDNWEKSGQKRKEIDVRQLKRERERES